MFNVGPLILAIAAGVVSMTGARALPASATSYSTEANILPPCISINHTTVEWFLSTTYMKHIPRDQCLFYTRRTNGETKSLSQTATAFAQTHGLISIWLVWPSNSTIIDRTSDLDFYSMYDPSSPLRCIRALGQDQVYFKHMSEAYARLCSGRSYVMTDNPNVIPREGIWWDTEYPTLHRDGGQVDEIVAIDVQGKRGVVFYDRDGRDVGTNVTTGLPRILARDVRRGIEVRVMEPEGMDVFG